MQRLLVSTGLSKLMILAALVMLLSSCGGADLDEVSPALTFDGISSAATTTPTRTLSGTVEPGASVEITQGTTTTQATVTGDRWTAPVPLQPGVNLLTVSAADARGNQSLFPLSLTYDAVSIEAYTTPIATTSLTIAGLIDPDPAVSNSLALEVTLPDKSVSITSPSAVNITGDTWSATVSGLQEGGNVLRASVSVPGVAVPVEVLLTIKVNLTDSIASVAFDQGLSSVVLPAQILKGTADAAAAVKLSPLPIETLPITAAAGVWSATVENLNIGKNPFTASVTDPTSKKTTVTRALLRVEQAPPLVENISPAKDATGVAVTDNIVVVFNEAMVAASVEGNLTLSDGASVLAMVTYDETTLTATLDPNADLTPSTTYTVTLDTGATDARTPPNNLTQTLTWSFTTAP
jgi:Bacterial Ig-like domain